MNTHSAGALLLFFFCALTAGGADPRRDVAGIMPVRTETVPVQVESMYLKGLKFLQNAQRKTGGRGNSRPASLPLPSIALNYRFLPIYEQ
ncbi:MAG: hypothetical protein LUE13_07225 [Akkermansiaceae bacterium]|nr:hypothetical protein [Akkermansiaceae bacterium]